MAPPEFVSTTPRPIHEVDMNTTPTYRVSQVIGASGEADGLVMGRVEPARSAPASTARAVGTVESAVRGAGGFHVRLSEGAAMPTIGAPVYLASPAVDAREQETPTKWCTFCGKTEHAEAQCPSVASLASREAAPAPAGVAPLPAEQQGEREVEEPVTEGMIEAGAKAAREHMRRTGGNDPAVIYRAMRRVALAQPAPVAAPAPASEAVALTEMQCREIYWALDKFGRDIDHYDYGLPMLDFENRAEEVFTLMRGAAALASHAAPQAIEVTDAMVTAYLDANDAYWKRTDELPATNPSRWRQGTPREATMEGLRAALQAAQSSPAAWCCEKGQAAGMPVCPECAEASAAYSAAMAPEPDDTPLETGEGDAR